MTCVVGSKGVRPLPFDRTLDDSRFGGVLCRFSYMLVGEPLWALRETLRVLRPGGRVAFSTWGEPARRPLDRPRSSRVVPTGD